MIGGMGQMPGSKMGGLDQMPGAIMGMQQMGGLMPNMGMGQGGGKRRRNPEEKVRGELKKLWEEFQSSRKTKEKSCLLLFLKIKIK